MRAAAVRRRDDHRNLVSLGLRHCPRRLLPATVLGAAAPWPPVRRVPANPPDAAAPAARSADCAPADAVDDAKVGGAAGGGGGGGGGGAFGALNRPIVNVRSHEWLLQSRPGLLLLFLGKFRQPSRASQVRSFYPTRERQDGKVLLQQVSSASLPQNSKVGHLLAGLGIPGAFQAE